MNKHRALYYCMNVDAIFIIFGIISAIYAYTKEDSKKYYIAVAITAISIVLFIVLYILYNFADHDLKVRWASYLGIKLEDNVDYEKEIEVIKQNFNSDTDRQKNVIAKPNFGETKPFCDFNVIKNGDIYYACVVEANLKLFAPSKFVHQVLPAVVVYSLDEFYNKNPFELKNIAKTLYAERHNNILKNETNYFSNIKITNDGLKDKNVYMTTIMAYRKHLPWGGLPSSNLIVPVIANPNSSTSVFILDSKYWTNSLIAGYLNDIISQDSQNNMPNNKVEDIFGDL